MTLRAEDVVWCPIYPPPPPSIQIACAVCSVCCFNTAPVLHHPLYTLPSVWTLTARLLRSFKRDWFTVIRIWLHPPISFLLLSIRDCAYVSLPAVFVYVRRTDVVGRTFKNHQIRPDRRVQTGSLSGVVEWKGWPVHIFWVELILPVNPVIQQCVSLQIQFWRGQCWIHVINSLVVPGAY